MLCLIAQPNSVVIEVEVDHKAIGQECLDKVCKTLGIIEVDYFGLQFVSNKGHKLWLNMRNEIRVQLSGPPPFRLQLKVKFFVDPHYLLQEATRHLFYLHIKDDLLKGNLVCDAQELAKLLALIRQSEIEEHPQTPFKFSHYSLLFPDQDEEILQTVIKEHEKIKEINKENAEYLLIQEASKLRDFGVEFFTVKSDSEACLRLGVGIDGISLYDSDYNAKILYSQILLATNAGKCVILHYKEYENGEELTRTKVFKLDTAEAANGLYRALTEKHVFYSCEMVQDAVTGQFIRDLKGTIISIFNENTELGKKYVFDVRRTRQEAREYAQRTLYQMNSRFIDPSLKIDPQPLATSLNNENCDKEQCKALREKLASLEDCTLCKVCMASEMNTAFFPCGHILCCQQCAELCPSCPLCRSNVKEVHFIFLPINELSCK